MRMLNDRHIYHVGILINSITLSKKGVGQNPPPFFCLSNVKFSSQKKIKCKIFTKKKLIAQKCSEFNITLKKGEGKTNSYTVKKSLIS